MLETVPVTISAQQINLKLTRSQTTILLFSWILWLAIHRQSGLVLFRLHHVWSLSWEDSKAGGWNHRKGHLFMSSSWAGKTQWAKLLLGSTTCRFPMWPDFLTSWQPQRCGTSPRQSVKHQHSYRQGEGCVAFYDLVLDIIQHRFSCTIAGQSSQKPTRVKALPFNGVHSKKNTWPGNSVAIIFEKYNLLQ